MLITSLLAKAVGVLDCAHSYHPRKFRTKSGHSLLPSDYQFTTTGAGKSPRIVCSGKRFTT